MVAQPVVVVRRWRARSPSRPRAPRAGRRASRPRRPRRRRRRPRPAAARPRGPPPRRWRRPRATSPPPPTRRPPASGRARPPRRRPAPRGRRGRRSSRAPRRRAANPSTPGPDLGHHPGEVAALPRRERRRPALRERPRPDRRLAGVDRGGADGDDHAAGRGGRRVDLAQLEHVDAAVPVELDRLGHQGPATPDRAASARGRRPAPDGEPGGSEHHAVDDPERPHRHRRAHRLAGGAPFAADRRRRPQASRCEPDHASSTGLSASATQASWATVPYAATASTTRANVTRPARIAPAGSGSPARERAHPLNEQECSAVARLPARQAKATRAAACGGAGRRGGSAEGAGHDPAARRSRGSQVAAAYAYG